MGAEIIDRARLRRRDRKLVGLLLVARPRGRLLCRSQVVGLIKRRKLPIIVGIAVQIVALALLLYCLS